MKTRFVMATIVTLMLLSAPGLCARAAHGDDTTGAKKQAKKGDKEAKPELPVYTGPKKRIAVLEIKGDISSLTAESDYQPPANFGAGLTEMLNTELVKTNRYLVVERKALPDVIKEQTLKEGGATDIGPEVGKLTGAQVLVTGAITEYSYKKSKGGGGFAGIKIGGNGTEAKIKIDLRLIDTTTGAVIDSIAGEGHAKASGSAVNFNIQSIEGNNETFADTALGKAVREAMTQVVGEFVKKMDDRPWEAHIADVDAEGGKVTAIYIIGGSRLGLKEGDELEILKLGREIKDPDTGEVVRTPSKTVGRCRVDTLTDKLAIAKLLSGDNFTKEDTANFVVHLTASPAAPVADKKPEAP